MAALEDQVFVDLVRDDEQVAGDRELGDRGQFGGVEDRARRVVRGVQQEQPGARGDQVAQGVEVGAEVRGAQGERDADGATMAMQAA